MPRRVVSSSNDLIDLASGNSADDNHNGIPDQCECRADLDRDGNLTIFDFIAFQDLFSQGDPAADFTGDG